LKRKPAPARRLFLSSSAHPTDQTVHWRLVVACNCWSRHSLPYAWTIVTDYLRNAVWRCVKDWSAQSTWPSCVAAATITVFDHRHVMISLFDVQGHCKTARRLLQDLLCGTHSRFTYGTLNHMILSVAKWNLLVFLTWLIILCTLRLHCIQCIAVIKALLCWAPVEWRHSKLLWWWWPIWTKFGVHTQKHRRPIERQQISHEIILLRSTVTLWRRAAQVLSHLLW